MKTLGVNIDHIATLRQARRGSHPDPLRALKILKQAGADSVTAHLREDRRHIQQGDISRIIQANILPLNLEISLKMVPFVLRLKQKPQWVCLVPENRQELTTEGGLDLVTLKQQVAEAIKALHTGKENRNPTDGSKVSLFVDPTQNQIECAIALKPDAVELHTGSWCNDATNQSLLARLTQAAEQLAAAGIKCNAGHGLDYHTTATLAKVKAISEFNIGHFLVGEAVFEGLGEVVTKMKRVITHSE